MQGVDEEEGEFGEVAEDFDHGGFAVVFALEEHGAAVGCDGVVDAAGGAVDGELADERPPVDSLELFFGFVAHLVWMRAGQSAGLDQEGGRNADADTCTAAQTCRDWNC